MYTYNVKVNGIPVCVQSMRVSALPLNRIWDGNQRPFEQTETAYYITVDISEAALLEIEITGVFDKCEIRPLEKRIDYQRDGAVISIPIAGRMQFTVEPDGYHHALHVFVNPKSEKPEHCTRYFGKGIHDVGLLWLQSNETIYLEEGAVVEGVIYGKDVHDVKICGRGVIDSGRYRKANDSICENGKEIKELLEQKGIEKDDLNYYGNLVLRHCENVWIEGVILKDAPMWSVIIRDNCKDITMDNLKVIGQWRYNSDGIDICTSKNVTLKNSFIRSFDDCIVVRGAYLPGEEGNVENILIENCVCWCDWGISLETWTGQKDTAIRNVVFKEIYLIHISTVAIDITSWYGSEKILVENIVYDGIFIDADEEYVHPVIEGQGRECEIGKPGFVPYLLLIRPVHIGKMAGQGSQKAIPVDTSAFRFVYRNIILNRIRYQGKEDLLVHVVPVEGLLELENLIVTNSDFELTK